MRVQLQDYGPLLVSHLEQILAAADVTEIRVNAYELCDLRLFFRDVIPFEKGVHDMSFRGKKLSVGREPAAGLVWGLDAAGSVVVEFTVMRPVVEP